MQGYKDGILYKRQVYAIDNAEVTRWVPCKNGNGVVYGGIAYRGTMFQCTDYMVSLGLADLQPEIIPQEEKLYEMQMRK